MTCGAGESETTVTIGAGQSFNYKTSARGKYSHNVSCLAYYLMDQTCAEMTFSCRRIFITNDDNEECSKGDILFLANEDDEKL